MASSSVADGGAKEYACETCSRVFNKKANLKVHSRKHTGEKPYACSRPGCGRRFMWKSSVSFHEQNCLSSKRESDSLIQSVPKRPKVVPGAVLHDDRRMPTTPTTPGESPPRTRITDIENPHILPVQGGVPAIGTVDAIRPVDLSMSSRPTAYRGQPLPLSQPQSVSLPNLQHQNQRYVQQQPQSLVQHHHQQQLSQQKRHLVQLPMNQASTHLTEATSSGPSAPQPLVRSPQILQVPAVSHPQPPVQYASSHLSQGPQPAVQKPFASQPQHAAHHPPASQPATALVSPHKVTPIAPPFVPESQPLPAPSTLLSEKRLPTAGRPPVIPSSIPKHYYSGKPSVGTMEQPSSGPKAVFDLKVPTSVTSSAAKPPVMYSAKMPKMPISMELDDSDDEGTERIVGAQDAFMRTGNPFGGFAPPTRCSPLPASSPIVCPGFSPMPLSPLAPFSPLPPDSPAHNAPNPVHPPLNQTPRSSSTNH